MLVVLCIGYVVLGLLFSLMPVWGDREDVGCVRECLSVAGVISGRFDKSSNFDGGFQHHSSGVQIEQSENLEEHGTLKRRRLGVKRVNGAGWDFVNLS
jgi:hypothetical protein